MQATEGGAAVAGGMDLGEYHSILLLAIFLQVMINEEKLVEELE